MQKKKTNYQKQKEKDFREIFDRYQDLLKVKKEKDSIPNKIYKTEQDKQNAAYYNRLAGKMFRKWPDTKYDWGNEN